MVRIGTYKEILHLMLIVYCCAVIRICVEEVVTTHHAERTCNNRAGVCIF